MRKLLVKLFNIIFVGLGLFATLSLAISPVISVEANFKISADNLHQLLVTTHVVPSNPNDMPTKGEVVYKVPTRGGITDDEEVDIFNKLTAERIVYGSETTPGVGSIEPKEPFKIELPAKACFDLKNQTVIKDWVLKNIDEVSLKMAQIIMPKLKIVIKGVAMDVANDIITEQVNIQILEYYKGEGEAPLADPETITEIVQNVYSCFENNEETTIKQLSEVLLGSEEYVVAEQQPTGAISSATKKYFVKSAEGVFSEVTGDGSFDPNTEYYVKKYGAGVKGVLQDLDEKGIEGFNVPDYENLDISDIENKMVEALQTMPGLTEKRYHEAETQPTGLISESTVKYFTKGADGTYTEVTGDGSFAAGTTYYVEEVVILNADDALMGLMDAFLNKTSNKAPQMRATEPETTPVNPNAKLEKAVQDMIKGVLPMARVETILNRTVTRGTPLVLAAYMGLLMFPWALFALISLIRTFRKNKCWTKLWIVYVFGFIQLILGIVLTLGTAFAMSKILPVALKKVVEAHPTNGPLYASIANDCTLSIETGCYLTSIIYVIMIALGIIYACFAHRLKVQHKLLKRVDKHDKKYHYDEPEYVGERYPSFSQNQTTHITTVNNHIDHPVRQVLIDDDDDMPRRGNIDIDE